MQVSEPMWRPLLALLVLFCTTTKASEVNLQDHLLGLSKQDLLPASHKAYLYGLRAGGFEPQVIYDIGSSLLHWAKVAREIWPNATIILFDAFEEAEFLYQSQGYSYHICMLSNIDGVQKKFYQNDFFPGGNSYYREIAHNGKFFPEDSFLVKKACILDKIVFDRDIPLPDLIKIDTQGSELDIMRGGLNTLMHAEHLIVEMQHERYNEGAPLASKTMKFITAKSMGFELVAPRFSDNGPDADYGFKAKRKPKLIPGTYLHAEPDTEQQGDFEF